jgi:hypothetical protein
LEVLGSGGFATVYRAELIDPSGFTRPVALKLLQPGVDHHDELLARLRDEARMLGRLRHHGVPSGLGLARIEPGWAAVMEHIDGVDCAKLLGQGPLPPRVGLEIVAEVASVLDAAWRQIEPDGRPLHLLHRDIKPHNIVVDVRGAVRVLDFGAARALGLDREAKTQGLLLGTLRYLAPERLEGTDLPASDVYALGVSAVELITGQPFQREHVQRGQPFAERQKAALLRALDRSGDGTPQRVKQALAHLIVELIGDVPELRPTAEVVERRARDLSEAVDGPGIRRWAAAAVPPLLAARRANTARDLLCDGVYVELVETTDAIAAPAAPRLASAQTLIFPDGRSAAPPPRRWGRGLAAALIAGAGLAVAAGVAGRVSPPPAPPPAQTTASATPATRKAVQGLAADAPEPPPAAPAKRPAPPPKRPAAEPPVAVPAPAPPPEAAPAPAPAPAPPPQRGRVQFAGDVPELAELRGPVTLQVRESAPAPVPGDYAVYVRYAAADPLQSAGSVVVPESGDILIRCARTIPRCNGPRR